MAPPRIKLNFLVAIDYPLCAKISKFLGVLAVTLSKGHGGDVVLLLGNFRKKIS